MKFESAVNFRDYDSLKHYAPGSFNSKYKTDLTGSIQEIEKDSLPDDIASNFLHKQYQTGKTLNDLVLYRVFGLYSQTNGEVKGARSSGGYASTEFAESLIDTKLRLALAPEWFSTKAYEEKILLPKGSIINVGIVAPVTLKTGTVLPGGADQILLPRNWSEEDWTIGYRRVTTRQLINPPEFKLKKSDLPESDVKATVYKIPVCCYCSGFDVTKLEESEQFEVEGSKGNRYIMRFHCNNPKCGFYW